MKHVTSEERNTAQIDIIKRKMWTARCKSLCCAPQEKRMCEVKCECVNVDTLATGVWS